MKIRNLTKIFGYTEAVSFANLNIYHGQIRAILGHNGAGKTTLISMLIELVPMTDGDIKIGDSYLTDNLVIIRKNLGVYPELTVHKHLYLYAEFKETEAEKVDKEISDTFDRLNMHSHGDAIVELFLEEKNVNFASEYLLLTTRK